MGLANRKVLVRSPSSTTLLAAVLATVALCSPPVSPEARATGWNEEPSRRQIERLQRLEPYVRYFTSLSYGRNDARVPASYIRALILTESGGLEEARSGVGARGLTQIMPSTGAAVVEDIVEEGRDYLYVDEAALGSFDADDLYDPALNILIACRLSAAYFSRYTGRTELVVAAWNAGPTAVAVHGNRPPPYRETRDLIARVKGYMTYLEKELTIVR